MATLKWQCQKCGKQESSANPPAAGSCPSGQGHVWSRLGRFLSNISGMFRK